MTGPEHYRRAGELAAEAHRLPGQGDGQATASVWSAVAQTHAVLALAAATAVGSRCGQQTLSRSVIISMTGHMRYPPSRMEEPMRLPD
jgi:hypothetical protein